MGQKALSRKHLVSDEDPDDEDEDELDDEERFWIGVEPLHIGILPELQQEVKVYCAKKAFI